MTFHTNPFAQFALGLNTALGQQQDNPQLLSSFSPLILTRLDDRPFLTTTKVPGATVFLPSGSLSVKTPAQAAKTGFQSAPGAGVQSFAPGAFEGLGEFGFEGARLQRGGGFIDFNVQSGGGESSGSGGGGTVGGKTFLGKLGEGLNIPPMLLIGAAVLGIFLIAR